ncbi:MAG: hypothetical protein RR908_06400, partial [Rikenellaceae bacterium]
FIYNMVRVLFMPKINHDLPSNSKVLEHLLFNKLRYNVAYRIAQAYVYLGCESFSKNVWEGKDMTIVSDITSGKVLDGMVSDMNKEYIEKDRMLVLVIQGIYKNKEIYRWWRRQNLLKLDIYWAGIIIFDSNLNRQEFKLRL